MVYDYLDTFTIQGSSDTSLAEIIEEIRKISELYGLDLIEQFRDYYKNKENEQER